MARERIGERTEDDSGGLDTIEQNVGPISDPEEVRNTIMERYDADESILQPPESPERSLGEAILHEIQNRK